MNNIIKYGLLGLVDYELASIYIFNFIDLILIFIYKFIKRILGFKSIFINNRYFKLICNFINNCQYKLYIIKVLNYI